MSETRCRWCEAEIDDWVDHLNCERNALRALRDRLVALNKGPEIHFDVVFGHDKASHVIAEIVAIIATAEALSNPQG